MEKILMGGNFETKAMPAIPRVRCKDCGREFTPDTDDVDFVEWILSGEGVECRILRVILPDRGGREELSDGFAKW
jgi:hypothetical protein